MIPNKPKNHHFDLNGALRAKKGEVVGPAGGETGVPRCLAEVQ